MSVLMRYWGRKPLKLVDELMNGIEGIVVDPFGGSGNIILSALNHGNKGIYLDVNPYAWLVAFVNMIQVNAEEFRRKGEEVLKNLPEVRKTVLSNDYLYYSNGKSFEAKRRVERVSQFFSPDNFRKLYSILKAIDNVKTSSEVKIALYGAFCVSLIKASKMNRKNNGTWAVPSYWIPERHNEIDALEAFNSQIKRFYLYFKKNKGYRLHQDVELMMKNALSFKYDKDWILVTDPPYYDEIQYFELSFFYWAWLKESEFRDVVKEILGEDISFDIQSEIIVNRNRGINYTEYLKLLGDFLEKTRDMKKKYLFFHHDEYLLRQRVIMLVKEKWGEIKIKDIVITNHRTIGDRGGNKYILIYS